MSKTKKDKFRTRSTRKGVAIRGYDSVAYFTEGTPTRGSAEFTHRWADAEWRFASAEHRDQFAANPEAYAPQFGGNCSVGAATGHRINGSPKRWRIEDNGRLYFDKDIFAYALHRPLTPRIHRKAAAVRGERSAPATHTTSATAA